MGRTASGVRAINVAKTDSVFAMEIVDKNALLLSVTENGFGKKTKFGEYRVQSRGGKGIINVKVTSKNGKVVNALAVQDQDEIVLVSTGGMVVRLPVNQIRTSGRNAVGVRLIRLKGNQRVAAAARVVEKDDSHGKAELPLGEDSEE